MAPPAKNAAFIKITPNNFVLVYSPEHKHVGYGNSYLCVREDGSETWQRIDWEKLPQWIDKSTGDRDWESVSLAFDFQTVTYLDDPPPYVSDEDLIDAVVDQRLWAYSDGLRRGKVSASYDVFDVEVVRAEVLGEDPQGMYLLRGRILVDVELEVTHREDLRFYDRGPSAIHCPFVTPSW
jgi:hypothetical protein